LGREGKNNKSSTPGGVRNQIVAGLLTPAAPMVLWKPYILNWYKHQISTAKLEATNRKIGSLQRNACGYRDEQYLKLRIYNIHTATYALTG